MVTFVKDCVSHMRKRKIIMCCLILAIIIQDICLAVTNGVFHIGDLFGEQQANILTLAAVIISGLAAVVLFMMIVNRNASSINFAQAVKGGRVKEAKLSYFWKTPDFSRETDYNIPMSEFWELDVAVENKNHFIEHAVLRCKVQEKTDISDPEIDIISKTIRVPYCYYVKSLSQEKIDIESLREAVGSEDGIKEDGIK